MEVTVVLAIIFALAVCGSFVWYMCRKDKYQAVCEIQGILDEIVQDKTMLSAVRLMTKENGIPIDKIAMVVGDELIATMIILRLENMTVSLGPSGVRMPVAYQKGSELFIFPRWLKLFQQLEERNWKFNSEQELKF